MKKVYSKKSWSALIIAISIIVFLTMIMVYFLEKIVPASKTVRWVENSTAAYYQAQSGIEQALLFMSWSQPWAESWATFNPASAPFWYWFTMTASWYNNPPTWLWVWNSEYDSNWMRIWPWEPFQLAFKEWLMQSSNLVMWIRVPNLDWDPSTPTDIEWWTWLVITWSISWNWKTLYSSWGITADEINYAAWRVHAVPWNVVDESSNNYWVRFWLTTRAWNAFDPWYWNPPWNNIFKWDWKDLDWTLWTLLNFYNWAWLFGGWKWLWTAWNPWSDCTWYKCSFKLSVVRSLKSTTWKSIPYLELRFSTMDVWFTPDLLPLQYAVMDSQWYSYWFKRNIHREIKQTTTIEAMDFTIFQ